MGCDACEACLYYILTDCLFHDNPIQSPTHIPSHNPTPSSMHSPKISSSLIPTLVSTLSPTPSPISTSPISILTPSPTHSPTSYPFSLPSEIEPVSDAPTSLLRNNSVVKETFPSGAPTEVTTLNPTLSSLANKATNTPTSSFTNNPTVKETFLSSEPTQLKTLNPTSSAPANNNSNNVDSSQSSNSPISSTSGTPISSPTISPADLQNTGTPEPTVLSTILNQEEGEETHSSLAPTSAHTTSDTATTTFTAIGCQAKNNSYGNINNSDMEIQEIETTFQYELDVNVAELQSAGRSLSDLLTDIDSQIMALLIRKLFSECAQEASRRQTQTTNHKFMRESDDNFHEIMGVKHEPSGESTIKKCSNLETIVGNCIMVDGKISLFVSNDERKEDIKNGIIGIISENIGTFTGSFHSIKLIDTSISTVGQGEGEVEAPIENDTINQEEYKSESETIQSTNLNGLEVSMLAMGFCGAAVIFGFMIQSRYRKRKERNSHDMELAEDDSLANYSECNASEEYEDCATFQKESSGTEKQSSVNDDSSRKIVSANIQSTGKTIKRSDVLEKIKELNVYRGYAHTDMIYIYMNMWKFERSKLESYLSFVSF